MVFVQFPITNEIIESVVYSGLKRIDCHNNKGFLHGLMIAIDNWNLDEKYSELYNHLYHYIVDEPDFTPAKMIKECIEYWIKKYLNSAQQGDAPELASPAR